MTDEEDEGWSEEDDQIGRSTRPGESTDMISLGTPSLLMLDAGEATELLRGDRRLISELAGDGCWELDSLDFRFLRNIYDFLMSKN